MAYRLGQFECAACGRLELAAAPAVALESRRGPPSTSTARSWDPGAQYRQPAAQSGEVATATVDLPKTGYSEAPDTESGWSGQKWWGLNLLIIGGVGFVLPAMGLQFIILSLFAPFELIAAGAFVLIGGVLLISDSG